MKDRAIQTAEALKAAAEVLGFTPDSDRFFTFVNSQFNAVYYSDIGVNHLTPDGEKQAQATESVS